MRVYVVGAILGVIFQNKDRGVFPIGTVRNSFDHAAEGQVIVGNGGCRARQIGTRASRVIVGQVQQDECRQFKLRALVRVAGTNVGAKFVHEFVGAELVGIVRIEIGRKSTRLN